LLKINLKAKQIKNIVARSPNQVINLTKLVERVAYLEYRLKELTEKRGK